MKIMFIAGLVLVALGTIALFGQPKRDKRTKTGLEKNKTTSYGLCFILILIGSGLLYVDSKFFSDEQESNISSESSTSYKERNNTEDTKEPNTERSNSIRSGDY
tara:strand:- start:259 stop:570 length:312 start_codon:yes stop_codon:yes gene_type:complete